MRKDIRGFTLLELMITLAVLAIVLGSGAPALAGLLERARVTRTLHLTTAAMATARIEAVRRNRPVSICPSADGARCRDNLTWDSGWLIFTDSERVGQPVSAADILQVFDGPGNGVTMRATSGRRLVRFHPNGWSAGSNVTLRICDRQHRHVAQVVVNNAGRARVERLGSGRACPF